MADIGTRGDCMKIGFIGAGKAGCSLGKYFSESFRGKSQGCNNISSVLSDEEEYEVTGYYSLMKEEAIWAADFTNSHFFENMDELVAASDSIILSTPDGAVKKVWDRLDKSNIRGKMICHLSGSLSSDVFSGCGDYGGYPISIHPMFAFSDKESVYKQLNQVSFTLEGQDFAVEQWKKLFAKLGNKVISIDKKVKPKYHAAASVLSNHVIAVLQTGYEMLVDCGFSEEEARSFSQVLVRENVEHVINHGAVSALTGPIERADYATVEKHLAVLDKKQRSMYQMCGEKLVEIARQKNPERDYRQIEELLKADNRCMEDI
jgi:predicted short-subunit dehydrogenase-like oxidoreductase (DUF2520 family)